MERRENERGREERETKEIQRVGENGKEGGTDGEWKGEVTRKKRDREKKKIKRR